MKDLMGFTVIGGMIAFLIWGLLNPGKIKMGWGDVNRSPERPGTPAPPEVLMGGLIFAMMCALLLVLKSVDRLDTVPLIVIVSVAMCGWMYAMFASRRAVRKRKQRDEGDQTRPS